MDRIATAENTVITTDIEIVTARIAKLDGLTGEERTEALATLRVHYNNAEYVRRELASITKRTYPGVENDRARLAAAKATTAAYRKALRNG